MERFPDHQPHGGVSRRTALRALGAAAGGVGVALGVTGCSSGALAGLTVGRPQVGQVDYWNLFGGGDGVRMQQMEDGYRKANPGTALQAVTLAWGNPYYTKLTLATVGRKPPNVAVSHLTRMKTLQAADLLRSCSRRISPGTACRPRCSTSAPGTPGWSTARSTRSRSTRTRSCCSTTPRSAAGRPARRGRQPEPLQGQDAFIGRAGEGQEGDRPVRRDARHQRRHGDPVAVLPDAVLTARRRGASRRRHQGGARRREGHAGPDLHACAHRREEADARQHRLPGRDRVVRERSRPASTSTASGRSPPSRPRRCRSA